MRPLPGRWRPLPLLWRALPVLLRSLEGVRRRGSRALRSLPALRPLLALLLCSACGMEEKTASASVDHLSFGQFGEVAIYRTGKAPKTVVVFLSGDGGWGAAEDAMAQGLAGLDALVVGVDFSVYHGRLGRIDGSCLYPAGGIENLSKLVQKKLGLPRYQPPILIGYGASAPLAYAALAQAPSGAFLGAVSLGFCPEIALGRTFCEGSGLASKQAPGGKVQLLPGAKLEQPWVVVVPQGAAPCAAAARAFAGRVSGSTLVGLPPARRGASEAQRWMARLKQSYLRIANAAELARPPESATLRQLPDLPLLELPPSAAVGDTLAVLVSGDGGWSGVDRQIAGVLAERGVPVVGINTLQYFWTPRTPDGAAADLARILRTYLPAWHRQEAVLAGYSLGAEVLPFMAARLPPDLLGKVRLVTLMGPGRATSFEFRVSEMRGHGGGQNLPVLPEVARLKDKTVLCLYGNDEKDESLCTQPGAAVKAVEVSGGHYLGDDYKQVAEEVLRESQGIATARAAASAAAVAAVPTPGNVTSEPFNYGRFGRTIVYHRSPKPKQVVLYLSDAGGMKDADGEAITALAQLDALVVAIEVDRYLARAEGAKDSCLYLAGNLELLSRAVQKRFALPAYVHPVVAGRGLGAALAYAALAQAPPNTFHGALSLGFCPELAVPLPLCGEHRLETKALPGGRYRLLPAAGLEQPWTALNGDRDKTCPVGPAQELAKHVPGGTAVGLPGVDHDFGGAGAAGAAGGAPRAGTSGAGAAGSSSTAAGTTGSAVSAAGWLVPVRQAFVKAISAVPSPAAGENYGSTVLADLPVVEMPPRSAPPGGQHAELARDGLAVVLSGDGGWAGVDREIGKVLAHQRGIPVVGFDCLQYLWNGRTPERAAADLERLLRHYLAATRRQQVLLVGYSLGADVLPFMISRLPADLRARLALVALLGPSHSAPMEIRLTEDKRAELPVLPEAQKLRGLPLLCIAGKGEHDSLCPDLDAQLAQHVELSGSHAFDGDYPALVEHILAAVRRPGAAPTPATPATPANTATTPATTAPPH
jgi:type IV secretory pathway VirJ component